MKLLKLLGLIFWIPLWIPFGLHANLIEDYHVKGGIGYRVDSFNWNIADSSGHPNVLSELEWKDIYMAQYSLRFDATFSSQIYVKGQGDYGSIAHGVNIDKDYGKDNRRSIFSFSKNNAGKGCAYDFSGGLGYVYNFQCFRFIPLVGYSYQKLFLRQYDGFQVFYIGHRNPFDPDEGNFKGPIEGLNSSFNATFHGPWVGADFYYDYYQFYYYAGFEYHWADYRGLGYWNLRKDFANDFVHEGKGHGELYRVGVDCDLTCGWGMGLMFTYQNWRVKNGRDRSFFFDFDTDPIPPGGEVPVIVGTTKLNKVSWHSFLLELSIYYSF